MNWGMNLNGGQYRFTALRKAREAKYLGVAELAAELGVSRQTIWRMERGYEPSLMLIRKASQVLGLDWREIVQQ